MPLVGVDPLYREVAKYFSFCFFKRNDIYLNRVREKGFGYMIEKIISTIITFLLTTMLGYCVSSLRTYKANAKKAKDNEEIQNQALKTLLQNSLTNTFFVYESMGEIPDYVYKNWLNLLSAYESLDGDDYIHTLAVKMSKWKIVKTDIL